MKKKTQAIELELESSPINHMKKIPLQKIAEGATLETLNFLAELSQVPGINEKIAKKKRIIKMAL